MKPAQQRAVVRFFRAGFRVSERRACRVAGVPRSRCRDRSVARDHAALRGRRRGQGAARVRSGSRRRHILRRREGGPVHHKRGSRLDREAGLAIRGRRKRQRTCATRVTPAPAERPQERWSMDFLTDSLVDGRRVRGLTFVAKVSRVSPAIAVDAAVTGERVVAILAGRRSRGGVPEWIAGDNGPEVISKALDAWADRNRVHLEFSWPDKPTDNAVAERCNGRLRDECLAQHSLRVAGGGAAGRRGVAGRGQHRAPPAGTQPADAGGRRGRLGIVSGGRGRTLQVDQSGGQVKTTCGRSLGVDQFSGSRSRRVTA